MPTKNSNINVNQNKIIVNIPKPTKPRQKKMSIAQAEEELNNLEKEDLAYSKVYYTQQPQTSFPITNPSIFGFHNVPTQNVPTQEEKQQEEPQTQEEKQTETETQRLERVYGTIKSNPLEARRVYFPNIKEGDFASRLRQAQEQTIYGTSKGQSPIEREEIPVASLEAKRLKKPNRSKEIIQYEKILKEQRKKAKEEKKKRDEEKQKLKSELSEMIKEDLESKKSQEEFLKQSGTKPNIPNVEMKKAEPINLEGDIQITTIKKPKKGALRGI